MVLLCKDFPSSKDTQLYLFVFFGLYLHYNRLVLKVTFILNSDVNPVPDGDIKQDLK